MVSNTGLSVYRHVVNDSFSLIENLRLAGDFKFALVVGKRLQSYVAEFCDPDSNDFSKIYELVCVIRSELNHQ